MYALMIENAILNSLLQNLAGLFPHNDGLSTLNVGWLASEACDIPAHERKSFEKSINDLVKDDIKHHRSSLKHLATLHQNNVVSNYS